MTLEEMKAKKKELGYSYEHIADYSGVPLSTVQKVFSGATQSPRYDTLRAIERVLSDPHPMAVKEAAIEYGRPIQKRQGEYTVTDYYGWPEEDRIELIDGVIYDLSAPDIKHQELVGEIAYLLRNTPNVLGFLGGMDKPTPIRQSEINRILGTVDELQETADDTLEFVLGEVVKVNTGPFSGFNGTIEEINTEKKKLKVMVKIFGRSTPVELGYMQVDKE